MNYLESDRIKIKLYNEFAKLPGKDKLKIYEPQKYAYQQMQYVERRFREIKYKIIIK